MTQIDHDKVYKFVTALKADVERGKQAERQLKYLQDVCTHTWGPTAYMPVVSEGYTVPGDAPGTMGVDWRGPQYVPATETPRWSRTCTACGKVEQTFKTRPVATEPVFGD